MISGAELFVKALKAEHVDTIFAYPGGQAIDLFDALYGEKSIHVILPRHEQGLVHAADGYARSTKKDRGVPGDERPGRHKSCHRNCNSEL